MLTATKVVLLVLAGLFVLATALPLIREPHWWIRMFDFPRAQILAGATGTFALLLLVNVGAPQASRLEWAALVLLGVCVAYQIVRMWPYSEYASPEVVRVDGVEEGRHLRLVMSNVLMENRDADGWLTTVRDARPDVVAAVETDAWWVDAMEALADELPHVAAVPQDDTYGMAVRSRLPIVEQEVRHLVEPSVPSLWLTLELDSGEHARLVILHPRPPRPDIQQGSQLRDAELVLAGRAAAEVDDPVVVAGDLNDVAWSYTTSLFQEISGLLDPRVGRGMFATFHADHWWLRYPLDHVFHSRDFGLVELERLAHVGSDHFPIMIELALDPSVRPLQEEPDSATVGEDDADEALDEAEEFLDEETEAERRERLRADQ